MASSSSSPSSASSRQAISSLVQTQTHTSHTEPLSAAELSSLQDAISHLAVDQVSATLTPSHRVRDPGPSRQRTLWSLVLEEADNGTDQAASRDVAVDEVGSAPYALSQLNDLLTSMDHDVANTLRLGVSSLLSNSKASPESVASELADVLGYGHLELVGQLVEHRDSVAKGLSTSAAVLSSPSLSQACRIHLKSTPPQPSVPLKPASKPYTPASQLLVSSAQELADQKALRAVLRRQNKGKGPLSAFPTDRHLTFEEMEQIREQQLEENARRPLTTSQSTGTDHPRYPHVFASAASGSTLSIFGAKFALPLGTTRKEHKEYEEVTIPPPRPIPMRFNERLVPIDEMDPICQGAFPGYTSLNRLQSVVYPLGYGSNENLLVCAPTGAGKTDVAMLTVLRAISQFTDNLHAQGGRGYGIKLNDFKIIYVAPMKALAAEIVRKFSNRLAYLGVKVRELTGDMQMTREEISATQMIVTTPEKWDVVTRKPTGEGELAAKVKLLIIDEVHLLHEDRGAVIETIVARTLRLVESSQSLIRIVGLSATLPNYVDVADFLRVNRYQGLFYFDSSFRPVPLEQHFIGVKGKPGSPQSRTNLDKAMFSKVEQLIQDGHQVMVFVHARKETVKTATTIREMCKAEGSEEFLLAGREDKEGIVNGFKRDLASSRNKELKELFESGLGIHHAGMLRSDRTLSERMFETGVTRVLCCTSTLAWGVNLPAYAVLIKGTEVYDSSIGQFVDLSILDVLQIFGRAGRPQYEDLGVGYICTPQEKLNHYIDAITSQHPIESKFDKGLVDSLNAECALGTVQSVPDGISWLSYTYLFVRMRRNPMAYGMSHDEVVDDPHLGAKRLALITGAAKRLVLCKMMEFDQGTSDKLVVTDLGRIAARYYIPWKTIEIFNEKLRSKMTEADVLNVLTLATDFEQIIPRDAEEKELKKMLEKAPCQVPGGFDTSAGKVNILLQAYISRTYVDDFALASDSAYVAHNTGRIIRALFEISLHNKWSSTTMALINMSKAVERRMWPFDHPLGQSTLTPDTLFNIQRWADDVEIADLAAMPSAEIGEMIHLNEKIGTAVHTAARQFPRLAMTWDIKPITYSTLRIDISAKGDFEWNERLHGRAQAFYVWVEDESGVEILQWTRILMRATLHSTFISFTLPISQPTPAGVTIQWISDSWLGSQGNIWISFQGSVVMPRAPEPHISLLDVPLLPTRSVLQSIRSEVAEEYCNRFPVFNALQSQVFHTVMHTSSSFLLAAPVASGRSTMVELAIWRELRENSAARMLYLVPHPCVLQQTVERFSRSFPMVRSRVISSPWQLVMEDRSFREEVLFALPSQLLQYISTHKGSLTACRLSRIALVVAEDLHLMNAEYELALSRVRQVASLVGIRPRLVATSASLDDASSVAGWLGIKDLACYSFDPKDRPVPLRINLQSFDLPHSYALLKTMVKPVYDRARAACAEAKASGNCNSGGSCLIFVPSASQCLPTALDLVTRSASSLDEQNGSGFLGCSEEEMEPYLGHFSDRRLREAVVHGVGVCHDGLNPKDRTLMLELYKAGMIQILVVPREACWSISVGASLVVVMSAQYVRIIGGGNVQSTGERRTMDYPTSDLLRMASLASRQSQESIGECLILCQTSQVDSIDQAVIRAGLPLESSLADSSSGEITTTDLGVNKVLAASFVREVSSGRIKTRGDFVDSLTWSFLFQRLHVNPSYYGAKGTGIQEASARLSDLVDSVATTVSLVGLVDSEPGMLNRPGEFYLTALGKEVLKEEDDTAIFFLLELFRSVALHPQSAAEACKGELSLSEAEIKLNQEDLITLRDRIPGEWLTVFGIARADRKAKRAREMAREKEGEQRAARGGEDRRRSIEDAAATSHSDDRLVLDEGVLPQSALLLCAYFSSTKLRMSVLAEEEQVRLVLKLLKRRGKEATMR